MDVGNMEHTVFVVDGQTLVNNIHFIKTCIYNGLMHVHIPICATNTAEELYRKSEEMKEARKNDKPKRWSGRPRREQQPLFDINPRTTTEFLERAKAGPGITGVTLQTTNEQFTQWQDGTEKIASSEQPPAPNLNAAEALLRRLNIKEVGHTAEDFSKAQQAGEVANGDAAAPHKPKVPVISSLAIAGDLRPLFSCALWRMHECNTLSPAKEIYELLSDDERVTKQANTVEMTVCSSQMLRTRVHQRLAERDDREARGELEDEFPDVPRRILPILKKAVRPEQALPTNGEKSLSDEAERALEAVALSVVQGLDQGDGIDERSEEQLTRLMAAELRPSVSYAMAAGSTSSTPVKPKSFSPPQPFKVQNSADAGVISSPGVEAIHATDDSAKASEAPADAGEGDTDSDEEVVVFNPKARQAAQANKKRRSREIGSPVSKPISRPATANGPLSQPNSPRISSSIIKSVLKPDSPVFSPRQLMAPTSPMARTSSLSSPSRPPAEAVPAAQAVSPPQHTSKLSPQTAASQPPNAPRHPRASGQPRQGSQEAAQRQSELILQRQREAIKRSTQLQEEKLARMKKEALNKANPREVDMRPTTTPVVIDPDDFGRDYTIKPGAVAGEGVAASRPRGDGRSRRGGRGRAGNKPPAEGARGGDVDFVLKSGNPRGASRGKGKLWVP